MINVGITEDVRLEYTQTVRIDQVLVPATPADNSDKAIVESNIVLQSATENKKAEIKTTIVENNLSISK